MGRSGAWLLVGLAAAVAAAEHICDLVGYPLTFLQSFPWRGLLVYYLLGFVLEYYPPSARIRRGVYALAPFALAWTVATPYLFAGPAARARSPSRWWWPRCSCSSGTTCTSRRSGCARRSPGWRDTPTRSIWCTRHCPRC
ncbi:acyltransferase family protein [Paeniclostridium sordellii]|nr:acyltransferase family protein [Paeniclostridium sordellii]